MSVSTISRKVRDGIDGWRYTKRVYAVELKDGGWTVAMLDSGNRVFLPLGQELRRIAKRDVTRVKDITASWYCGT